MDDCIYRKAAIAEIEKQEAPTVIESDECAKMKKLIKLILEVDTEDDVSINGIERDLMQEINCASYSYTLKKCEVIEAEE